MKAIKNWLKKLDKKMEKKANEKSCCCCNGSCDSPKTRKSKSSK